jgi:hypothetical protein
VITRAMQHARPVLVAALGSIALGACFRDRAPGGTLENRPGGPRELAASGDPLAFLPIDSEILIGVDARQVLASAVWKQLEPQIMPMLAEGMREFQARCGYDPLETLHSVTVGLKDGETLDGVFVMRGPDRERTMKCLAGELPKGVRLTIDRGVITIPSDGPGDPAVVMTFAGARTLVAATSREKLDAALAGGAPLRSSRAFAELWGLVDSRQAAWAVVNGASSAFDDLTALGIRPRALFGSIGLASGLSLTGRVRLASPDEATQLAALGQGQLGMFKAMADRVDLGTTGADVTVRVDMTAAQVDSLSRLLLGSMLGNPLGGP